MSAIDEDPYTMTTRSRVIRTGYKPQQSYIYYDQNANPGQTPHFGEDVGPEMCELQITESEGHPFWSDLKTWKGIKPDEGGDFVTTRWTPIVNRSVHFRHCDDWGSNLWEASAPFIPSIWDHYGTAFDGWGYFTKDSEQGPYVNKYPAMSSSDDELIAYGTTAIAKTRPDVSPAQAMQFLVELRRDGIPFHTLLSKDRLSEILHIFEKKGESVAKHSVKEASDLFLEDEFGLKPFLSDLESFKRVQSHGINVLDNLYANSGKSIRRRFSFPNEKVSTTQGVGAEGDIGRAFGFNHYPFLSNHLYFRDENGRSVNFPPYNTFYDVNTHRKTWFSGAYLIHMPTDLEPVSRLRAAADHLRWDYGLDLNISTLWNLAPWTWLLDWQFNLGDLITNVSKWQDDAVVLQYGYIMQETITRYIVSHRSGSNFYYESVPDSSFPAMGVKVHKKRRLRATPYGFGVAYGSISSIQKAILAAIGITRF